MLEIDVFNSARAWLAQEGAAVIQLVPPGGQAPLSLSFKVEDKLRTVFPDLLVLKEEVIWVGELKPKFDRRDHAKLKLLREFAAPQIRDVCGRMLRQNLGAYSISYVLCHSDAASSACDFAYQWIFGRDDFTPFELATLR